MKNIVMLLMMSFSILYADKIYFEDDIEEKNDIYYEAGTNVLANGLLINSIGKIPLRDGYWDGVHTSYFNGGGIYIQETYRKGEVIGPKAEYYDNGIVKSLELWQNGETAIKLYYRVDGSLKLEQKMFYQNDIVKMEMRGYSKSIEPKVYFLINMQKNGNIITQKGYFVNKNGQKVQISNIEKIPKTILE